MNLRILFVDDEPQVLQSIERSMFEMADEWEMLFAQSGLEALEMMWAEPVHVVVSDMRMPGMSGMELLTHVKEEFPQTIRFVLTGQVDDESALRSVDLAHQFLTKPCNPEQLRGLIERALSLRQAMSNERLESLIGSLDWLPSLPGIYEDLMRELNEAEPSIRVASEIIQQDTALTAKLLQIVNSAFFGLRSEVNNLVQAATILGLGTLKTLVVMNHTIMECGVHRFPDGFLLDAFAQHGVAVGACCEAIAVSEAQHQNTVQDSFTAGMLHDLGKLVLAYNLPDDYGSVLSLCKEEEKPQHEIETMYFGANHADVGAYLLGIWGLPDPIVEAVALHHKPLEYSANDRFLPACVTVANRLVTLGAKGGEGTDSDVLSPEEMDTSDLGGKIDSWRNACEPVLERESRA